jgi:predicted DNA-binding WGR domain protein
MPDARLPVRHHLVLYRRDLEQGQARFFSLMNERDLFGTIRLVRNWGTVGSRASDEISDPMSSASQQSRTHLEIAGGAST